LDGDGLQDLVWPHFGTNPGLVCMGAADGSWTAVLDHPLLQVDAHGFLWADLNMMGVLTPW